MTPEEVSALSRKIAEHFEPEPKRGPASSFTDSVSLGRFWFYEWNHRTFEIEWSQRSIEEPEIAMMLLKKLPEDTVVKLRTGISKRYIIGVPIRPDPQTQINHRQWTEEDQLSHAIALAYAKMEQL